MIRAGFSLSRALFRKNVGPLPNIRIPPDWIHTTRTVTWANRCASKQGCVSITSRQHLTWHFMTPARHKNRFLIIISGMLLCCKNLQVLLWGPLFVGPLFGRTCWTCLNPPLNTWFLGITSVHTPNGISIGSVVFGGLTIVTDRQTTLLGL